MTDLFPHETSYRGAEALDRLGRCRVIICGAGALGSHVAENLVRQGFRRLSVIDFDRVEAHNVSTQVYDEGDIGALKVEVLRARCFRAASVEIEAVAKRLTAQNAPRLLRDADVVCDAFDNAAARQAVTDLCRNRSLPCMHLGMNAGYGEVRWNDRYRVPRDTAALNVCDYPLARNLVLLVVALASEAIIRFVLEGQAEGCSVTLRDLRINLEEP